MKDPVLIATPALLKSFPSVGILVCFPWTVSWSPLQPPADLLGGIPFRSSLSKYHLENHRAVLSSLEGQVDFGVKMQGAEPVSTLKVSESEGKLEGPATAVTPNKNSSNSSGGGGGSSSSSGSSRGGSAKGWQYRYDADGEGMSRGGAGGGVLGSAGLPLTSRSNLGSHLALARFHSFVRPLNRCLLRPTGECLSGPVSFFGGTGVTPSSDLILCSLLFLRVL